MKALRKICQYFHRYLGWVAGIVFIFFCVTGCLLLVQPEIERFGECERFVAPSHPGAEPLSVGEFITQFETLEASTFPEPTTIRVERLQTSTNPRKTWRVVVTAQTSQHSWNYIAYADPFTGQGVAYGRSKTKPFFKTIRDLHVFLAMKSRQVGVEIIGYAGLLSIMVLATGFIRWIPRRFTDRKALANSFRPVVTRGGFRAVFSLHNVLGFYSTLVLVLLSLTGVWKSLGWVQRACDKLIGYEAVVAAPSGKGSGMKGQGPARPSRQGAHGKGDKKEGEPMDPSFYGEGIFANRSPENGGATHHDLGFAMMNNAFSCEKVLESDVGVDSILDKQRERTPNVKGYNIVLPPTGSNRATIITQYGSFAGFSKPDVYYWDQYTGEFLGKTSYADLTLPEKIRSMIIPFHKGTIFSACSRYFFFVSGLLGIIVAITGYWLMIYRYMQKSRSGRMEESAKTSDVEDASKTSHELPETAE